MKTASALQDFTARLLIGRSVDADHVPVLAPGTQRILRISLATIALLLIAISLRPFKAETLVVEFTGEGDTRNQIGFLLAGGVFGVSLLGFVESRVLRSLISPSWLAVGGVLIMSVLVTDDIMGISRGVLLTLIGMLVSVSVLVLPLHEADFQRATMAGILLTLAVAYVGVVLLPGLAVHGTDGYEPQHAGFWRGHFTHKNIAGPMMSMFAMFGIYFMRSGHRLAGLLITVLCVVFLIKTGSKTPAGFLPVSVLIVLIGGSIGRGGLVILMHLAVLGAAFALTLGGLSHAGLSELAGTLLGDATFTGRTTLWRFGVENIDARFWTGHGFDNFWATSVVRGLELPYENAWDFRGIVHGHNNYIDLMLNLGLIGTVIVGYVLYIAPLLNYLRARRRNNNRALADLFMMIVIFLSLLSLLETFFLRRTDPIWMMQVIAVFGLHLLGRMPSKQG